MQISDLTVSQTSTALAGKRLDIVVSGSIGAVESVRFIRALRRLGAEVFPYLTDGGKQFITATSLEWASTHPVTTSFNGTASHLASHDGCIIAPASANIISSIAAGLTGTPATALIASYLGAKKPVFLVPNMHNSLIASPQVSANLHKLEQWLTVVEGRHEEGKAKFPAPDTLADLIAHKINTSERFANSVLITMGTTRGYVDEIRYFSNYSSGKLGSLLAEELYRQGLRTEVVCGPAQVTPRLYTNITHIETNDEMQAAAQRVADAGCRAAVFVASVLDFIPDQKAAGKIKSDSDLKVSFRRSAKIIQAINPPEALKIGFKLETELTDQQMHQIAQEYTAKYNLKLIVFNLRAEVSATQHSATIYERHDDGSLSCHTGINSKETLARFLADFIKQKY